MHVDDSSNASGSRAGLILTSREGDVMEYTLHFEFLATNNEAKYETPIAGLKVMRKADAQHLKVFNDSQLIVGQIKGGYEI